MAAAPVRGRADVQEHAGTAAVQGEDSCLASTDVNCMLMTEQMYKSMQAQLQSKVRRSFIALQFSVVFKTAVAGRT